MVTATPMLGTTDLLVIQYQTRNPALLAAAK